VIDPFGVEVGLDAVLVIEKPAFAETQTSTLAGVTPEIVAVFVTL
jgi:hypothetical protein